MKVLVIGGCGYIGSALCDHLLKRPNYVSVHSTDLEWFGNLGAHKEPYTNVKVDYNLLKREYIHDFDAVVLVAAHSSVAMCQKDPYGAIKNNVTNFTNLIEKIRPGQKFIYASSSCVYTGNEGVATEETILRPPCDYLTLTKQTIDHIASLSDVEFYSMRFGSVAGWSPNLRSDLMVNAMVLDGLSKGVIRVMNGTNYRPILSIHDLCRAVEAILNCGEDRRGVYNLANFNVSINTVSQAVAIMTGANIEVGENTTSYDFKMSSDKFCQTFDFEFSSRLTTIIEGLLYTIKTTGNIGNACDRNVNKEYVLE